MIKALEAIFDTYQQADDALRIAGRVAKDGQLPRLLRNTAFEGETVASVEEIAAAVRKQLEDQTVVALYAAFESALRDHLAAQAVYLTRNAVDPDADFAAALGALYVSWCEEGRMDKVAALYRNAAGENLVAQAGQIRVYRNWLAHGRRGPQPPQITPGFAFRTLKSFLAKI